MARVSKDVIRQAAEDDLYSFIRLVAPHRVLGACHRDVIKWWTREDAGTHQMLLYPRDHQKSAMLAYRCAWEITRNPTVTILYISSTSNLAEKQLKFIKDILTSPRYRRYWPEMVNEDEGKREKWTNSEISVDHPLRAAEGIREPTVFTAGLTTSITGLHCNIACLDDVVVNENAYTKEGRDKVQSQYSLLASIETTDAREWVVGTRYHPKDLYGTLAEITEDIYNEDGEIIDSRPVYEVLDRTVEDMGDGTGVFLWPRMQRGDGKWFGFNQRILARKRAQYLDKSQFYAQYYNNPNSPTEDAIDREYFQYYNRDFLKRGDGVWQYNGKPLSIFAAIDFAFSLSSSADYTALAVIGVDWDGHIYVLDLQRVKTNKVGSYYQMIYDAHIKWGFKKVRAEVTAAQRIIVEHVRDEIRKDGLMLTVDDFNPTRTMGTKEERIIAALKHRYENRSIWHYYGGMCEELEFELISERPPNDDLKDALHSAMGIMKIPQKRFMDKGESNIVTHSRFGGVAFGG